jgi:hypothetical protein
MESNTTAPTLKKINPTYTPYVEEKPVEITKTLMISPPYTNWDIKKLFIDPPTPLKIEGVTGLFMCSMWYMYTVDGKETKDRFRIEFPIKDESMSASNFGVMAQTKALTEEEKKREKAGEVIKRETTGKFELRINIQAAPEECKALRKILDDIYIVSGMHLYKYGNSDKGSKMLLSKYLPTLERPEEAVGPDNVYETLRYPIFYQTKKVAGENGMVDRCDQDISGSIAASVPITGKSPSTFILDDGTKLSLSDVTGRGFLHSPEIGVSLFIGAKNKLKFTLANTIVTKWLSSNTVGRQNAIEARKNAGISTSESMKNRSALLGADKLATGTDPLEKEKEEERLREQERLKLEAEEKARLIALEAEQEERRLQEELLEKERRKAERRETEKREAAATAAKQESKKKSKESVKPEKKRKVKQPTPSGSEEDSN